jgi:hypothetical protein
MAASGSPRMRRASSSALALRQRVVRPPRRSRAPGAATCSGDGTLQSAQRRTGGRSTATTGLTVSPQWRCAWAGRSRAGRARTCGIHSRRTANALLIERGDRRASSTTAAVGGSAAIRGKDAAASRGMTATGPIDRPARPLTHPERPARPPPPSPATSPRVPRRRRATRAHAPNDAREWREPNERRFIREMCPLTRACPRAGRMAPRDREGPANRSVLSGPDLDFCAPSLCVHVTRAGARASQEGARQPDRLARFCAGAPTRQKELAEVAGQRMTAATTVLDRSGRLARPRSRSRLGRRAPVSCGATRPFELPAGQVRALRLGLFVARRFDSSTRVVI